MEEVTVIGLDLAKSVFQLHGATATGTPVFRKKLSRAQVLKFFGRTAALPRGHGGLRIVALLGPRDHEVGACGSPDPADLRETVRQAPE